MRGLKKKWEGKEAKSEAGDWLVTFADLMALLFAFFVLLTTLSTAPKSCNGIAEYFEKNREKYTNFELRNSKVECVITLPSDYLFRTGQDQLQQAAFSRLRPLFETIKDLKEHKRDLIIVEGHTDDVPIRTRRFPSNWELSSARATNVAGFLRQLGYPVNRLSVRAFASNRPRVEYVDRAGRDLAGKELQDARRANRRVEIILQKPPKKLQEYGVLFK